MMMSVRGRAPLMALLGALALAADAGEMRRVEGLDFDHVDVMGSVKVEISQGDEPQLLLYGSAKDLDREPFCGQDALRAEREAGSRWAFVGLEVDWEEKGQGVMLWGLDTDIRFFPLHDDPRFQALLQKINAGID